MMLFKILSYCVKVKGNILGLCKNFVVDTLKDIIFMRINDSPGMVDQTGSISFYMELFRVKTILR